jgi:DNA polymerase-3 subunit delta'
MSAAGEAASATTLAGFLDWHDAARQKLQAAVDASRLPHALLVHGPVGVGKERLAGAVAAALLCGARGARLEACGHCPDCALNRAGSHPDLHWLRPEEDKRTISVDQVRDATEQLGMTSMRRVYRVAIVSPANSMTRNAQNALLKTLEEPAQRTLLLLVTARPSELLPTLRSRCQRIEVRRPDEKSALEWLAREHPGAAQPELLRLAGGAPLRALELAPHFDELQTQMTGLLEDFLSGRAEVTATAAEMLGEGLPVRLDWLEHWVGQIIRQRTMDATELTIHGGPALQRAGATVNISAAFRWVDGIREARRLLEGPAAPQLLVEALLVEAGRCFGRRGVN